MFQITIDMGQVTDWLNVGLTLSIVVLTALNFLIMRRLKWLTGAMERHSDQQRQLAARSADPSIKIVWWDKTISIEGSAGYGGGLPPHEVLQAPRTWCASGEGVSSGGGRVQTRVDWQSFLDY